MEVLKINKQVGLVHGNEFCRSEKYLHKKIIKHAELVWQRLEVSVRNVNKHSRFKAPSGVITEWRSERLGIRSRTKSSQFIRSRRFEFDGIYENVIPSENGTRRDEAALTVVVSGDKCRSTALRCNSRRRSIASK